jgi:hypothetical protein
VRAFSGHGEQVCKRQDGAEIQKYRNKGQYGAFCGSECVHFFHGDWDLVKTFVADNVFIRVLEGWD